MDQDGTDSTMLKDLPGLHVELSILKIGILIMLGVVLISKGKKSVIDTIKGVKNIGSVISLNLHLQRRLLKG